MQKPQRIGNRKTGSLGTFKDAETITITTARQVLTALGFGAIPVRPPEGDKRMIMFLAGEDGRHKIYHVMGGTTRDTWSRLVERFDTSLQSVLDAFAPIRSKRIKGRTNQAFGLQETMKVRTGRSCNRAAYQSRKAARSHDRNIRAISRKDRAISQMGFRPDTDTQTIRREAFEQEGIHFGFETLPTKQKRVTKTQTKKSENETVPAEIGAVEAAETALERLRRAKAERAEKARKAEQRKDEIEAEKLRILAEKADAETADDPDTDAGCGDDCETDMEFASDADREAYETAMALLAQMGMNKRKGGPAAKGGLDEKRRKQKKAPIKMRAKLASKASDIASTVIEANTPEPEPTKTTLSPLEQLLQMKAEAAKQDEPEPVETVTETVEPEPTETKLSPLEQLLQMKAEAAKPAPVQNVTETVEEPAPVADWFDDMFAPTPTVD